MFAVFEKRGLRSGVTRVTNRLLHASERLGETFAPSDAWGVTDRLWPSRLSRLDSLPHPSTSCSASLHASGARSHPHPLARLGCVDASCLHITRGEQPGSGYWAGGLARVPSTSCFVCFGHCCACGAWVVARESGVGSPVLSRGPGVSRASTGLPGSGTRHPVPGTRSSCFPFCTQNGYPYPLPGSRPGTGQRLPFAVPSCAFQHHSSRPVRPVFHWRFPLLHIGPGIWL